jgi:hypothetical protein
MRNRRIGLYTPREQELLDTVTRRGFYPMNDASFKFSCNTIRSLRDKFKVVERVIKDGRPGLVLANRQTD